MRPAISEVLEIMLSRSQNIVYWWPVMEGQNGFPLQGSGNLDVSTCSHHFRLLSGDPFADIRRAVSECSSVELSLSKKFHSVSVDQIDVLEIDCNRSRFGLYNVAKCIHLMSCNPAAYAQHRDVVS